MVDSKTLVANPPQGSLTRTVNDLGSKKSYATQETGGGFTTGYHWSQTKDGNGDGT